jgi:hypothetical protein
VSCTASLTYEIGDGGPWSDCRHTDGYFYCIAGENGHDGPHKAPVRLTASTDKEPYLYQHAAVVEWE